MATVKHRRLLSKAQLEAVGEIAAEWSTLEATVEYGIWQLLGWKADVGLAVTTHLGFNVRSDIFLSLLDRLSEDKQLKEEARALINHARHTLAPIRNEIVHGFFMWKPHRKSAELLTAKARGTVKMSSKKLTARQIQRHARDIGDHWLKLSRLVNKLRPENKP